MWVFIQHKPPVSFPFMNLENSLMQNAPHSLEEIEGALIFEQLLYHIITVIQLITESENWRTYLCMIGLCAGVEYITTSTLFRVSLSWPLGTATGTYRSLTSWNNNSFCISNIHVISYMHKLYQCCTVMECPDVMGYDILWVTAFFLLTTSYKQYTLWVGWLVCVV